jgi:molybdenum cofactor guanylyltransferase
VYHPEVDDLTAFILAGGKSTRMGSNKALATFGRQTLLEHAIKLVRALSPEVLIVGPAAIYSGYGAVVEDTFRDRGPLGGIQAALQASATELNLILAVDMPLIEARFLKYLANHARASTATVTVPRTGEGWQPLCAVYRQEFGRVAERSLREGRNKIDDLFTLVETRVVGPEELAKLRLSEKMFQNVNTPKDLDRAAKNL